MPSSPVYLITILALLNLANYLDRYLVAPLGPLIQKDLGLSDAALGLVGSAFLWGFLAASLAIGALTRHWPRKTILLVSAAVWMVSTAASGLLGSFLILIAFRAASGFGQAAFTACAPTVIDDKVPTVTRGRVLAVFYAAIPLGTALAFILGGMLGKAFGWQWACLLLGASGLPLLLLLGTAKVGAQQSSKHSVSILQEILDLAKSKRYILAVLGYAAQTFALGGFAFWAPTFLVRKFAYPAEQGSLIFGLILVATGFCGSILGGWMLDKFHKRDRVLAALKLGALLTLAGLPFGFLAILTKAAPAFFFSMAVIQLAVFATFSPINAAFLGAVKNEARTSAMGYATFFGRLFGDLISVWLVGAISDTTGSLTLGLLILPLALVANLIFWLAASRAKR
jgi:predicted MFS family arabinose efflux permease